MVEDCFKLVLHSQNAISSNNSSFKFNVDLKEVQGDIVRCSVKKIRYPAPATYIQRRVWLALGHIWLNSHLDPLSPPRQPNDYNNLLAKYGLNNWFYLYYPTLNLYIRMQLRDAASSQIRQVSFAVSRDGLNWTTGTMTSFGLQEGVHFSAGALVPFDFIEIDTVTPQFSKALPSTYIARRMWFASENTWKPAVTGGVNDYDALFAKYGLNTWIYFYYPFRNQYFRIRFNAAENTQVRNTSFSLSVDDGKNWSTAGNIITGWVLGTDFSGTGNIGVDLFEVDMSSLPYGTFIQNIHCPQLKWNMSYDNVTKDTSDIIANVRHENINPYVVNDNTFKIKDEEVANEMSASHVRNLKTLDIHFSRVATSNVQEVVPMQWLLELMLFEVV